MLRLLIDFSKIVLYSLILAADGILNFKSVCIVRWLRKYFMHVRRDIPY